MARIRTIKPEFWDSPSTASAGPWARLLFIALWNWADDYGRGTANLKELEGFAFPHDDTFTDRSGNTVNFRSLVAEVSACFGVVFYTVDGRPYFEIPTWDEHQRNERRAKQSKYPSPQVRDHAVTPVAEIPCNRAEDPNISGPGTGEQGNRGTGEQSSSSEVADATPRPEVDELLDYLDARIEANGAKVPNRTKKNRDAARLLLDKDNRTVDQVKAAIDFATDDEFWRTNILSMSKLREKYDTLRMRATGQRKLQPQRPASYPLPGTPEFAALPDEQKVRILEREQIREFNR